MHILSLRHARTWSHSDGTQRRPLCGHNKRACHGEREPMYPLHPLCPEDASEYVCVCLCVITDPLLHLGDPGCVCRLRHEKLWITVDILPTRSKAT